MTDNKAAWETWSFDDYEAAFREWRAIRKAEREMLAIDEERADYLDVQLGCFEGHCWRTGKINGPHWAEEQDKLRA